MGRGREITEPYQTKNARKCNIGSQTVSDKCHCREGNSPDPQLRSQSMVKWRRMWNCINNQDVGLEAANNQDVGLEAATHLKSA